MPMYTPLPKGSVRLLRLLPHPNEDSPIECQLITCSLLDSERTHSYDALSYTWGPEDNTQSISINGEQQPARPNLHKALSHLRDCFVERILWIDAICINQGDDIEKGHQVASMAKIYAKARGVIVWLGDAADGSDRAIKAIRRTAEEQDAGFSIPKTYSDRHDIDPEINELDQQAILSLLGREWFQRIWILQEVSAARHVLIKCGPAEMDGYAFCSGLSVLNLSYETHPHLLSLILPIIYLIRGATFRPRYEGGGTSGQDRFSLGIRPLQQLVDMYHTHKATVRLDKVYALLGMSDDDPYAAGLEPDYTLAWRQVFRKLVHFCISDQMSVRTWDSAEVAVIEGKGYILGEVSSLEEPEDLAVLYGGQNADITRNNRQFVEVSWNKLLIDYSWDNTSRFTLPVSVKAVEEGDLVCLPQGASALTIIRPCLNFCTIITTAGPPPEIFRDWSASTTGVHPTDLLLIWDLGEPTASRGGRGYRGFISRDVPKCPMAECWCLHRLDKAIRFLNFGMMLNSMGKHDEAMQNVRKAVEIYRGREELKGADKTCLGHGSWREEDEEALWIMYGFLTGDNTEAKYEGKSLALLLWAAENRHEAAVRLLVDKGASLEEQRPLSHNQTALLWAARNGHEAIVTLLIDKGANIEAKESNMDQTPLSLAARYGHAALVQLLADRGANIEATSKFGQTPLSHAAEEGREAAVQVLIDQGANIEAKDEFGGTALFQAVKYGHKAMLQMLMDKGANIDTKDRFGQTPLSRAVEDGQEATSQLLIDQGVDTEAEDRDGRTLLSLAAKKIHKAFVQRLIDNCANVETKDQNGQTPLAWAIENGNEALEHLLKSYESHA